MNGFRMILFGNTDQGRHIGGEKEWQRGKTRTLTVATVHPSIHPSIYSIPFSKALALCRVMERLELFLGHKQENRLRRWPVHHTHLFIFTRNFLNVDRVDFSFLYIKK